MNSGKLKLKRRTRLLGKWKHKKGGIVIQTRNQGKICTKPDPKRHTLMLKVTICNEDGIKQKLQEVRRQIQTISNRWFSYIPFKIRQDE